MAFDISDYTHHTAPLDTTGVDFDAFAHRPLDPGTLRVLEYMHDVEHHTICYLRDLLVTEAHLDPAITTFLTFWAHEEHWHGEALGRVLAAHGRPAGAERIEAMRRAVRARERWAPLTHALASAVTGPAFLAVHMTWGAVNEWTTQAGYARVVQRADHPVLTELLRRIMKQEGRHIDFYASEARRRLAGDRRAQRVTRWALRHVWRPVGASVMPEAETAHVTRHLFSGRDGLATADRIDRRVDRLPGLAGLGIVRRAAARYADPTEPPVRPVPRLAVVPVPVPVPAVGA